MAEVRAHPRSFKRLSGYRRSDSASTTARQGVGDAVCRVRKSARQVEKTVSPWPRVPGEKLLP